MDYENYCELQVWREDILELFAKHMRSPVLDVGCYDGRKTGFFKRKGFETEGCDISKANLKKAKHCYPEINFFCHNFEEKPLQGKKYGSMLLIEVLEHIADYNKFLKNVRASLEEGGTVCLTTPNIYGAVNRLRTPLGHNNQFERIWHLHFFGFDFLRKVLEDSGFEVVAEKGYSEKFRFIPRPKKMHDGIVMVARKTRQKTA